MAEEGTGVIISSHIVSKLEEFCDSVVVFRGTVPIVVRGSVDYEKLFEECLIEIGRASCRERV